MTRIRPPYRGLVIAFAVSMSLFLGFPMVDLGIIVLLPLSAAADAGIVPLWRLRLPVRGGRPWALGGVAHGSQPRTRQ